MGGSINCHYWAGKLWNGGWFWVEVEGLVIIVRKVDVGEVVRGLKSGSIESGGAIEDHMLVEGTVTIEVGSFGWEGGCACECSSRPPLAKGGQVPRKLS